MMLGDRNARRNFHARLSILIAQPFFMVGPLLGAGYTNSAAARNMPAYRIQSHTRHKPAHESLIAS
jgi:hypothetical protein